VKEHSSFIMVVETKILSSKVNLMALSRRLNITWEIFCESHSTYRDNLALALALLLDLLDHLLLLLFSSEFKIFMKVLHHSEK
jgi:hypothetical protein